MGKWQIGRLIRAKNLTSEIKSLTFSVQSKKVHKSGQYFDLRLPNDPKSERSFSTASAPEDDNLEFGVQLLKAGALSPKLFTLKKGDQIEIKGPNGSFVWNPKDSHPLLFIAGGSGLIPFISMLRHHYHNFRKRKIILLLSISSKKEIIYQDELKNFQKKDKNFKLVLNITKETKRINQDLLKKVIDEFNLTLPKIYICGSTAFTDNIFSLILKLGINPKLINRERFGPFIH